MTAHPSQLPKQKYKSGLKNGASALNIGDKLGGWTLECQIGSGGNGDVWKACRESGVSHALKVLRKVNSESYARFRIEIEILDKLGDTKGIIPMLERHIPTSSKGDTPWFVMPLAMPFDQYIVGRTPATIVGDFVLLGETIAQLHVQHISHRDIKPANFLYLNERLCLSDFGLVKYPARETLTPAKRDVGAKFTMAPEMRRYASAADGFPADVYSFSKSLWIALSGHELGFDGQYNSSNSVLSLRDYLPGIYTTTLDQLFSECTETNPTLRPSMTTVVNRLRQWLTLVEDFHQRNLIEWSELTRKLFPLAAPTQATWTDIDEICMVLSEIAKVPSLNHMFYPTGGGNTITGASRSAEPGLIRLDVSGIAEILKPEKLTYESFGNDSRWTYFRLEAAPIRPTGIPNALSAEGEYEALVEITPGAYAPYECWDAGEYMGQALPASARPASRFLKGAFVFFSTRSVYNQVSGTYDARHNKVSEQVFRDYISRSAKAHLEYEKRAGSQPG